MTVEANKKNTKFDRASTSEPNSQPAPSTATESAATSNNNGASDSKTFEFVLVTDAESRRQVRRHAMRQYMRQRRQDSIARLEPSRVSTGSWSKSGSPAESSRSTKLQELDDEDVEVKREASPSGNTLAIAQGNGSGGGPIVSTPEQFSFSNPMATPGSQAFYDPFNSYPITMNPADHNLIHHCEFTLISFSHIPPVLFPPNFRCDIPS